MTDSDMHDAVIWLAVATALAMMLSWLLTKIRPTWSRRTIVICSAGLLPLPIAALFAVTFISASVASKEACGVDACAMAMAFSFVFISWAVAAFCLSAGAALVVTSVVRR